MALAITVNGNIVPVQRSLEELKADIKDLEKQLTQTKNVAEIGKLNDALKNANAEMKRIKNIGPVLPSNFVPNISQANFVVTDFSRVVQDLPYGLNGIANNLTQLPQSLGALSAAAKESGKSMGSLLLSSITGVGGIGLAVSLLTSAFVIGQNGIAGFNRKTKEAKAAADELKKAIREVAIIEGEATAGVQGQITQVQALAGAVSNGNLPYNERKRALQELREINKAYFGDLKLEDAATGKLAATVTEYTAALINNAIQKQFVDEIAKVARAIVDADDEIIKSRDRVTRAQEDVSKKELIALQKSQAGTGGYVDASIALQQAQQEEQKSQEALNLANDKSTKLYEQRIVLSNKLNAAVLEGLKFKDLDTQATKKQDDGLKEFLKRLQEVDNKIHFQFVLTADIPDVNFIKGPKTIQTKVKDEVSKAVGADKKISIDVRQMDINVRGIKFVKFKEAKEAIERELSEQIGGVFENLKLDSLTTLGETIGNALTGGDFAGSLRDGARQMLSILGGVMQQLGKYVITAALKIKLLKDTLQKFAIKNPALAILAGVGLIAAGAALKNIAIDVPKFGDGAIVTGPTLSVIGEKGPETIIPLNKLPDILSRGKSNNPVNITVGMGISGRQIVPFIQRETKLYNRTV